MVRVKDRQEAVRLRKLGKSFTYIRKKLNVAKGTLSYWISGVKLTKGQLKKIQKEAELLNPRSGVYEGEFLTAERVMQLADIPSKEVLLSRLVGTMNAPLTGFMNAVTGNVRGFTMVLKGISEKK